jgi:hypothetical protein
MTQEVIVRLRDDFDQRLGRPDDPVETRDIVVGGVAYELELNGSNYELMLGDLKRWLAVARPKKRRRQRQVAKQESRPRAPRGTPAWNTEIHAWATEHGYDWDDPAVRREVRQWSEEVLGHSCRTGIVPRSVLETHYETTKRG